MKRHLGISVSIAMLVSSHGISLAQSPPATNAGPASDSIEELQRKLDQRDALIGDLIHRLDRLEAQQARPIKRSATSAPQPAAGTLPLPPGQPQPQVVQQSLPSSQQTIGAGVPKPTPPGQPQPQVAQQLPPASQPTGPAKPAPPGQPQQSPPLSQQSTEPGSVDPVVPGQSPPQVAQQSPPSSPQSTQQTPAESTDQPGTFSVSPEAAQHALEIALVQSGAGLLSPWKVEVVPSFVYQYNSVSVPGQLAVSTTGNLLVTGNVIRQNTLQANGLVRVGLPWDFQAEFSVPYGYKSLTNTSRVLTTGLLQQGKNAVGFGDPTFTLTKQLMTESEWLPNLFVSGTYESDLGQFSRGLALGAGFNEFRVGLLATKRQDPLVFTAGFTYQRTLEHLGVTAGDQFIPSVGLLFAVSPETSLQLSQQVAFADPIKRFGQKIPGSDQVQGIFSVGLLSILRPGLVVNLTASIGETPDAPNLTFQFAVPIRLN